MNALTLAIASIRARPLYAALCTTAVAAGIALLCAAFLFSQSISTGFQRNAENIDMVAGAKGSPLQLILSSVYHADIPAGNITMNDYENLLRMPQIRKAIPVAMGDSYNGYRMIGSTADYLKVYEAEFADGEIFDAPFEAVAGAGTGLKTGQDIVVSHGFSTNSEDVHDTEPYEITGVLKRTGTVLDNLIVTNLENVQQLHGRHHHDDEYEEEEHHHDDEHVHEDAHEDIDEADLERQLTSVLIKVRSPVDLMNLPRRINDSSNIMAAVTSYEIARFTKSLGVGKQLAIVLGGGFVILSTLMLWATLASGLALRRYDLAVLRVLGARPGRLATTVIAEAVIISGVGAVAGAILGHLIAYSAVISFENLNRFVVPESLLLPSIMDIGFILLGVLAGLFAALVPSVTAARTDISTLLAKGRV